MLFQSQLHCVSTWHSLQASFQSAEIVVNYSQNTQRIPLII